MADRIRGSCRGCLCFRNRGINDLAASICFAIVIAVDTRVLSIIKSYECVAVAMNTSKWNEFISSDKTCSKYTIAYREKGANEIDRVYYSGDGEDLLCPGGGELTENDIQALGYTLVWTK